GPHGRTGADDDRRHGKGAVGAPAACHAHAHPGQRRVKPVRLLPVVIFAAIALLLFKGVGLLTTGGYVLTGTSVAIAAGEEGAPEAGATPTLVMPHEPTMEDTS